MNDFFPIIINHYIETPPPFCIILIIIIIIFNCYFSFWLSDIFNKQIKSIFGNVNVMMF